MVTIGLVAVGGVLVVFLVYLVMKTGDKGSRHNQSSMEAVRTQQNARKAADSGRATDGID